MFHRAAQDCFAAGLTLQQPGLPGQMSPPEVTLQSDSRILTSLMPGSQLHHPGFSLSIHPPDAPRKENNHFGPRFSTGGESSRETEGTWTGPQDSARRTSREEAAVRHQCKAGIHSGQ